MRLHALVLGFVLVAAPVVSRADGILERIATEILASRFGIDLREITDFRRDTRETIWNMGPTYSMSRYGGVSAYEVQKLRASGKGWGQIANEVGMHPGDFNKLRKSGYFDRDPFWDDIYRRSYGVSQQQINGLRGKGATHEDILASVMISSASGRPAMDVFNRFRTDRDWTRTARAFNFSFDNWTKYGRRVRWEGKGDPGDKTRGNSGGKGSGGGKGGGKGG